MIMSNQSANSSDTVQVVEEPKELRVFRLIIYSLVIFASLLGNSVVLKAVCELSRKSLTHFLVANLAAAEILVSFLNPFLLIYTELLYWPFGEALCRLISPTQTFSIVVITNTLATIALHRYKVFSTRHTRQHMSNTKIGLLLLTIWVIALAIVFPSFLFQQLVPANQDLFPGEFWCIEIFPDAGPGHMTPGIRRFYMARFILNYVIPIIIMSVSYGFVSVKLRHHRNRSIRDESTKNTSEEENGDQPTQQQNYSSLQSPKQNGCGIIELAPKVENQDSTRSRPANRVNNRMNSRKDFVKLERDLLKMFYMIILVFLVCYFPYQVYFLMEYFGVIHWNTWKYFNIIRTYTFLIPCFSSALHPLCYGTMSKFFARAFSRLVLCKNRE